MEQRVRVALDGLAAVLGEVAGGERDRLGVDAAAVASYPSAAARAARTPEAAIASRYVSARGSRSAYARRTATVTSRFNSISGL